MKLEFSTASGEGQIVEVPDEMDAVKINDNASMVIARRQGGASVTICFDLSNRPKHTWISPAAPSTSNPNGTKPLEVNDLTALYISFDMEGMSNGLQRQAY